MEHVFTQTVDGITYKAFHRTGRAHPFGETPYGLETRVSETSEFR